MKTRTDLINAVSAACNVQTYLEIGVAHGTNLVNVKAPRKVGVDPAPHYKGEEVLWLTSDVFFEHNTQDFDLVFVDGDHQMPAPLNDILNALAASPIVLVHDACPTRPEHTKHGSLYKAGDIWMGQVWQALLYCKEHLGLNVHIWPNDFGVALVTGVTLDEPLPEVAMQYDFATDFTRLMACHVDADGIIAAAQQAVALREAAKQAVANPPKKTRKRKPKDA